VELKKEGKRNERGWEELKFGIESKRRLDKGTNYWGRER